MHIRRVKKNIVSILMITLVIASCKTETGKHLRMHNPLSEDRQDALIVLKRDSLELQLGKIPGGKFVTLSREDGTPLVAEYDDMNGDGEWDELAFLYSFKTGETVNLQVSVADAPAAVKAVVRAHVRQMRKNTDGSFGPALDKDSIPAGQPATDFSKQALPPFLTEGPAWENDKVGFRIYFDVRNGKDLWGKTTSRMMMDEVGRDTTHNYHLPDSWGMDILKVGQSLGAGSLALLVPLQNGRDSLARLGGKNIEQVNYEKLADGPVRAVLRLHYKNWKVVEGRSPVQLTEEISIWGGQYFYESRVWVDGAPAGTRLVTGIVNLLSHQPVQLDTTGCNILYIYDLQSENRDRLGMGIILGKEWFQGYGTTPNAQTDVQNTYTIMASPAKQQPVVFRFAAGWEQSDKRFSAEAGFRNYMAEQAAAYARPVELEWR
jgi:hypothetical protein